MKLLINMSYLLNEVSAALLHSVMLTSIKKKKKVFLDLHQLHKAQSHQKSCCCVPSCVKECKLGQRSPVSVVVLD